MEHPFLSTNTITKLTLDEIQSKISDLTGKLNFAHQTNNTALISQISMALNSYNAARGQKLNDMFPKDKGDDHSDKINIT
jgi:hypothetical protein